MNFVELINIHKYFGGVHALKGVSLKIGYGEIIGLLGDNGAGKSTLIKILAGVYKPDFGRILLEGKEITFNSPKDALEKGIATVYQHFALVPQLPLWRNFCLGIEPKGRFGLLKIKEIKRRTLEALKKIEIGLDNPDEIVENLSGGERQSVALARILWSNAKLMLLDEPTSALSVKESEKILRLIQKFKDKGVTAIIVSHNVYHVYPIADRIVVLDKGVKVLDVPKNAITIQETIDVIAHRLDPQKVLGRINK